MLFFFSFSFLSLKPSEDATSSKKSKRRKDKSRSHKKATSDPHLTEGKQVRAVLHFLHESGA